MEIKLVIPDSEVDGFVRRNGWTDEIQDPQNFGQRIPNPISQEQYAVNLFIKYRDNELIAVAVDAFERERQAVIDTKKEMLGSAGGSISVPPVRP